MSTQAMPSRAHGVPPTWMADLVQQGLQRCDYRHEALAGETPSPNIQSVFEQMVPTENSLQALVARAQRDSKKMLSLGDALMYSLKGWPRDPDRACNCWYAAAWGCSEAQVRERRQVMAVPVGSPEAMCMVALLGYKKLMLNAGGEGNSSIRAALRKVVYDEEV